MSPDADGFRPQQDTTGQPISSISNLSWTDWARGLKVSTWRSFLTRRWRAYRDTYVPMVSTFVPGRVQCDSSLVQ